VKVSGQIHVSAALLQEKRPLYPVFTGLKIGPVADLVWTFEKEEFSGNRIWFFGRTASSLEIFRVRYRGSCYYCIKFSRVINCYFMSKTDYKTARSAKQ